MFQRLLGASCKATVPDGLLSAIWKTGVWRLMLFLLTYSTGLAIIFPITPTLMTNGFASLAAGHSIDCTTYGPGQAPRECNDAHATVVIWMSWTNFISSSLLTFLCAPYVGHLSDRIGRKPFILAGVGLMLLPLAVLQLHLHGVLPIYWYYPASAAGGAVSSFTMTLTSVADLLEQRHRATAVGYLTSCFSLGMLAGPLLGGYLSVRASLWTCIALTAATLLYVAAFVPECAPGPLARRAAVKAAATVASPSQTTATNAVTPKSDLDDGVRLLCGGGSSGCGSNVKRSGRELDGAGCQVAEEEALAEAEVVSLVAAQQHLMSGGAMPSAAADVDAGAGGACALYGSTCSQHAHASTCGHDDGNGDEEEALLPYGRQHRSSSVAEDGAAATPPAGSGRLAGLSTGWAVIRHSSFYRRIAAIWVVVAMTWEGAGELLMQYLQYKLGFNTRDQAHVLTVLASGGLLVKMGLLALLVRWMGERRLLAFGLTAYAVECLALAAAPTKVAGLAAVSIGSLASVCWPALTALQTAGVDPGRQGAVFGALQAISAMASGVGPLVFAALFRQVTRSDSDAVPMPGAVWYLAAAMTAVAIALTLSLPQPPPPPQQQHDVHSQHGQQQGGQQIIDKSSNGGNASRTGSAAGNGGSGGGGLDMDEGRVEPTLKEKEGKGEDRKGGARRHRLAPDGVSSEWGRKEQGEEEALREPLLQSP